MGDNDAISLDHREWVAAIVAIARATHGSGDWAVAEERWADCLAQFPEHPERHLWLAMRAEALIELGRVNEAVGCFEALVVAFPDDHQGHSGLARLAQHERNWDRAVRLWDVCLSKFPEHPERHWWLTRRAEALIELGRLNEARECFETLIAAFPDDHQGHSGLARLAQRERDWDRAVRLWDVCLSNFPKHPERRWWLAMRAEALIELGRLNEARECFETLIAAFPDDHQGHSGLARLAQRERDWDRAVRLWDVCLSNFPKHPERRWWLAMRAEGLIELGRLNEARECFETLIAAFPEDHQGHSGLARLAQRERDWDRAVRLWDVCLPNFPEHPERRWWQAMRAEALIELGRLNEARECYEVFIAAFPEDHQGHSGLARLAQRERDWDRAVRLWDVCLSNFPKHPERRWWLAMRGYALIEARRLDEVAPTFEALVDEFPDDPHGHAGLAGVAERQWLWRSAIDHWDRCFDAAKSHPPQWVASKAHCLLEVGDVESAQRLFAMLAERLSSSGDGLAGLARIASVQALPEEALRRWDDCIAGCPEAIAGYLGKARVLLDRADYRVADALLAYVVNKWPVSVAAGEMWARCAIVAKQWAVAQERWKVLLERHPSDSQVRIGYTAFLTVMGDSDAANAFMASFAHDATSHIECLLEYHIAREDLGAAIIHSQRLAEIDPGNPFRRWRHVEVLTRYGEPEALDTAVLILEDLLRHSPEGVSIKARLVGLRIRQGRNREAAELLNTIPREDRRIDVEILRAWQRHWAGDERAAKRLWQGILNRQYFPAIHSTIGSLSRIDANTPATKPGDIVLFSAIRNELPRLRWFLDYYRRLGVDRFVFIDNGSTDGSVDLLCRNSDVILYATSDSYDFSGFGMRWINALIDQHGSNNWCIYVDVDEALTFADCERSGLRGLVNYMSAKGQEVILARMLDMYPKAASDISGGGDQKSVMASQIYFDNRFITHGSPICPYNEILGGFRRRMLDGYTLMNKTPVIKGSSGIKFLLSSHRITPAKVSDVTAALLHYHLAYFFVDDHQQLVRDAINRREFASNAVERRRDLDAVPEIAAHQSLICGDSVRFESSLQLVKLGVLQASQEYLQA